MRPILLVLCACLSFVWGCSESLNPVPRAPEEESIAPPATSDESERRTPTGFDVPMDLAENLPPSVAITRPALNSVVTTPNGFLLIAWTGSDPDGPVSDLAFEVKLQREGGSAVTWPIPAGQPNFINVVGVPPGSYTLTVYAIDRRAGNDGLMSKPAIMSFVLQTVGM